ncbi:hypothetical protein HC256_000546 [Beauveria bassiana]|nr:hypothetical protein HC256_000546 [Beauveria bassiana]
MFSSRAERIRRDLIHRAHAEKGDVMERGDVTHELPQASKSRPSRLTEALLRPLRLFRQPVIVAEGNRQHPNIPKSPRTTALGSSTQQRTESRATSTEPAEVTEPSPAFVAEAISSRLSFEIRPEQQNSDQNHGRGPVKKVQGGTRKRRFLFCLPWINSVRIRVVLLHCITSGLFVLLLLAVYLGLSLTQHIQTNELTVLLLLIIVASTMFFCYNMVRLCRAVLRGNKPSNTASRERRARTPADMLRTGYAVPRRPIQVLLAHDEGADGRENATNTLTPPAYGFWRESVRMDPNRLYWQRNEAARRQEPALESESQLEFAARSGRRPPSYASEDGVSYVVDAMTVSAASTVTASREPVGR